MFTDRIPTHPPTPACPWPLDPHAFKTIHWLQKHSLGSSLYCSCLSWLFPIPPGAAAWPQNCRHTDFLFVHPNLKTVLSLGLVIILFLLFGIFPPPRPRLKLNLCPVNATLLIACEVSTTLLASREAQRKMLKAQERSSWYLSSVFSDFLYLFFLPNNSISLSNAHIQKPEMIMNVFVCIQAVYQNVKN